MWVSADAATRVLNLDTKYEPVLFSNSSHVTS